MDRHSQGMNATPEGWPKEADISALTLGSLL
jgi:hypothetical protein